MFKSNLTPTPRAGFSMTFKNNWTISVQWHEAAYCSGRDTNQQSPDAEIAIWDSSGNWYYFGNDEVKGYCSPDEVLEWMNKVANFPK